MGPTTATQLETLESNIFGRRITGVAETCRRSAWTCQIGDLSEYHRQTSGVDDDNASDTDNSCEAVIVGVADTSCVRHAWCSLNLCIEHSQLLRSLYALRAMATDVRCFPLAST